MQESDRRYSNRRRKNDKNRKVHTLARVLLVEFLVLAAVLMFYGIGKLTDKFDTDGNGAQDVNVQVGGDKVVQATPTLDPVVEKQKEEEKKQEQRKEYIAKADLLAAGYDYDAAIEYIKSYEENYNLYPEFTQAITDYETKKAQCVSFGAYQSAPEVNHIFFHSLIYDTSLAFDGDYTANGYDYYMTTCSEFKEMMKQMYEKGYVLVSIHDVVKQVTKEDGTVTFTDGDIMLPPDKKPFVMSQDDVNYYDYMDGDGFASRLVIDENGRPATERILADGSTEVGSFDLVPILEDFIDEHPDFSYRGARGLICLTGYEGAMGYRTDPASKDSPTYQQDIETVKNVAKVMREYGWEFACHSNGHRDLSQHDAGFLKNDTNNWLTYVGALVGETDVYVYPYGIDIQGGVGVYNNDRYQVLKNSGFKIFCGVEAKPWMQIKKEYVRMQRRPLDGQAMLQYPERLQDLFDLSKVIDPSRPALQAK